MTIWSRLQTLMNTLLGLKVRKRAFVFDGSLAWDDWQETRLASEGQVFLISGETQAVYRFVTGVEQEFPGITDVCDQLQTMGCDKYMVTHALKYLIANKSRFRLDQRMVQLGVNQKVLTALALDISGDSFVAYLEFGIEPKTLMTTLPESMVGP